MSNCRDPWNRSKKMCVCGLHSYKAKNAKRKKIKRYSWLKKLQSLIDEKDTKL